MFSIASLINRAREVPAVGDGLAADFRSFYEWLTEAGGLLFSEVTARQLTPDRGKPTHAFALAVPGEPGMEFPFITLVSV
jgi:hypothetical protein